MSSLVTEGPVLLFHCYRTSRIKGENRKSKPLNMKNRHSLDLGFLYRCLTFFSSMFGAGTKTGKRCVYTEPVTLRYLPEILDMNLENKKFIRKNNEFNSTDHPLQGTMGCIKGLTVIKEGIISVLI